MARPHRPAALGSVLTFGGRVPQSIGLIIALLVISTIAGWLTGQSGLAALDPASLIGGELWRLVTWAFVQPRGDAFGLLFGGYVIWQMGQQLAYAWGERRFLARFLGLAIGASLGATALALLWAPANVPHLGIWPVANALLLSWALLHPEAQVSLMFVLPVTGRTFGLLIVFGTALYGIASGGIPGLGAFAPHFTALAIAYVLSRGVSTRRFRMGVKDWWAERAFQRRSRHLKVVKKKEKDVKDEPPRWVN